MIAAAAAAASGGEIAFGVKVIVTAVTVAAVADNRKPDPLLLLNSLGWR